MIRLRRTNDYELSVSFSKNEKLTFNKVKVLIGKAQRMIKQNGLTSVIIEINSNTRIHKSAQEFFNRVLCKNSDFPVAILN
jgi:hypothetical protein